MKKLFLPLALMLATTLSFAQATAGTPSCWPRAVGGTAAYENVTAAVDGVRGYWACDKLVRYETWTFFGTWADMPANWNTQFVALLKGGASATSLQTLWTASIDPTKNTNPAYATLKAEALADLTAAVPTQVLKVSANGSLTDRPVFPFANGVRTSNASAGRAPVGAVCSCATASVVEKQFAYCAWTPASGTVDATHVTACTRQ
jgi:hypothetical protein